MPLLIFFAGNLISPQLLGLNTDPIADIEDTNDGTVSAGSWRGLEVTGMQPGLTRPDGSVISSALANASGDKNAKELRALNTKWCVGPGAKYAPWQYEQVNSGKAWVK